MQPPEDRGATPPGHEPPSPGYPDDISRLEDSAVSTSFDADTGRRLKRAAVAIAIVLLIGFIAVRVLRFFDDRHVARAGEVAYSAPPLVDVVIAQPTVADQTLVLPGETAAWFESTIYARVNGYVANWRSDIGDHVHKGQILATLETPDLDAELAEAQAQLQAAEAVVVARKAEAEFSRTTNERWRDSPKGVVSDQERDAKKAEFETAQARLYAADAEVTLERSRVDQFRALAYFKQVTAPFDGTVTERKIDVGNLVTAGSTSATTPLYRVSQTDPLRVFVDVPQGVAGDLMQPGIPAEIRVKDAAASVVIGKIARSAQAINAQARTMRVEVDLANSAHALVPGLYVSVAFKLAPRGSVEVPAAALAFKAGGAEVARVGKDAKVAFVPVRIARDNGSLVELDGDIHAGDRLILNISSEVVAGETVSVNTAGEPGATNPSGSAPASARSAAR
jgi:RND family efflux transporter MFP subunit